MTTALQHQRHGAELMLAEMAVDGFALAGSSALREHGLIDRPTDDFDLFTVDIAPGSCSRVRRDRPPTVVGAAA